MYRQAVPYLPGGGFDVFWVNAIAKVVPDCRRFGPKYGPKLDTRHKDKMYVSAS